MAISIVSMTAKSVISGSGPSSSTGISVVVAGYGEESIPTPAQGLLPVDTVSTSESVSFYFDSYMGSGYASGQYSGRVSSL